MLLTKDQLNTIYNKYPNANKERLLDGLVDKGYELDGVDMNKARERILNIKRSTPASSEEIAGMTPKKNILASGVDMFFGGGKLAEGLGKGLGADDFYKTTNEALKSSRDQEFQLIKAIQTRKAQGMPTSNLDKALFDLRKSIVATEKTQEAFQASLPSNKAVLGSALRLAGSAVVPSMITGLLKGGIGLAGKGAQTLIPGIASRIGGEQAVGMGAGFMQGAKVGALGAGIEGAIQGAGFGMEADKDLGGIAKSAFVGGAVGAGFGTVLGGSMGAYLGNKAYKNKQINAIKNIIANDPDSSLARYVVDGNELRKDPLAKSALTQGYTEDAVAMAKGMSEIDKKSALQMIDIIDTGKNRPYFRKTNNPADVLGETAGDFAIKTEKLHRKAGIAVNETAKTLKGQRVVGLEAPVDELIDNLDELGVVFRNGQPTFPVNSALDGKPELQTLVRKVVARASTVSDDAYEVHRLKTFLYDEFYRNVKTKSGLGGSLEGVFRNFAGKIDSVLDNQFSAYNVANTDYKITSNLMENFYRVAGKNFKNLDEFANMSLGDLARRISGNARSRADLLETLYGMQKVVKGAGLPTKGDPIAQAVFLDGLEEMFRKQVVQTKGFQGQIIGAIKGTSRLRSAESVSDLTLDLMADWLEKGKNPEMAIKAMRDLLNGGGFGTKVKTPAKAGWITNLFTGLGTTSADEVAVGATSASRVAGKADDIAGKVAGGVDNFADDVVRKADDVTDDVMTKADNLVDDVIPTPKVVSTNVLARPPVAVLQDLATKAEVKGIDFDNLYAQYVKRISTAPADKKYIDDVVFDVASKLPDTKVAQSPIKSAERTLEKTIDEGNGTIDGINDIVRNSLVVNDYGPVRVEQAKKAIRESVVEVITEKKQMPENYMGYDGNIMVVRTPSNAVAEIQVVSPQMTYGKMLPEFGENIIGKEMFEAIKKETGLEPGYGHTLYEKFRKLTIAEKEGEAGKAIIAESEAYYGKLRNFSKGLQD
jgi:hypothetical protein